VFHRFSNSIRMEKIIADKCVYNVVFKNVQPTNNEKLEVRNLFLIYYSVQFS
jgi:hypothetical protein